MVTYGKTEIRHVLSEMSDLEVLQREFVREKVIRDMMRDSGEDRQTVTQIADAAESMGQEAVLGLTDGEPTTMRDTLERYVASLSEEVYGAHEVAELRTRVINDLATILAYPFPSPSVELEIVHRDEDHLEVRVGGMFLFSAARADHGRAGLKALENASRAVHREVTTRLGSA